jgi:hypothetical protein
VPDLGANLWQPRETGKPQSSATAGDLAILHQTGYIFAMPDVRPSSAWLPLPAASHCARRQAMIDTRIGWLAAKPCRKRANFTLKTHVFAAFSRPRNADVRTISISKQQVRAIEHDTPARSGKTSAIRSQ